MTTNRQPKGTPVGGQFAEGRKPDGGDLPTKKPLQIGSPVVVYGFFTKAGVVADIRPLGILVRTRTGESVWFPMIVVNREDFDNAWHVVDNHRGNIIAGGPSISRKRAEELAEEKGGVVRQGRDIKIVEFDKPPVDPGFGKPYAAGVRYLTEDERPVSMWRRGQKVRFYDDDGNQVGPEQSNVAPALAYTYSKGWREIKPVIDHDTQVVPVDEVVFGSVVIVNDTPCEVVRELEHDATKDLFGRTMNVITLRRLDTGEEGTVMFGPGGVVHQMPL